MEQLQNTPITEQTAVTLVRDISAVEQFEQQLDSLNTQLAELNVPKEALKLTSSFKKEITDLIKPGNGVRKTDNIVEFYNTGSGLIIINRHNNGDRYIPFSREYLDEEDLCKILVGKNNTYKLNMEDFYLIVERYAAKCEALGTTLESTVQAKYLTTAISQLKKALKSLTASSEKCEDTAFHLNETYSERLEADYYQYIRDHHLDEYPNNELINIRGELFTMINRVKKEVSSYLNKGFRSKMHIEENQLIFEIHDTEGNWVGSIYYNWTFDAELRYTRCLNDIHEVDETGALTDTSLIEAFKLLESDRVREEIEFCKSQQWTIEKFHKAFKKHKTERKSLREYYNSRRKYYEMVQSAEETGDTFVEEGVKSDKSITPAEDLGMYTIYIGIDCAPGAPRPDCYISDALNALGLNGEELGKQDTSSKLFGAWTWYFDVELNVKEIPTYKNLLKDYFDNLYYSGYIRGAEWTISPYEDENNGENEEDTSNQDNASESGVQGF